MMRVDVIVFNGVKFRRYPDSKYRSHRKYYTPGITDKQNGVQALHQEIWKYHHKRIIPKGYVIHHIDENPLNNHIDNLACISHKEHNAIHDTLHKFIKTEQRFTHLDEIRELSKAWHKTDESRRLKSKIAREAYKQRPLITYTCIWCGEEYQSRHVYRGGQQHFCSRSCGSKWRWRRDRYGD